MYIKRHAVHIKIGRNILCIILMVLNSYWLRLAAVQKLRPKSQNMKVIIVSKNDLYMVKSEISTYLLCPLAA